MPIKILSPQLSNQIAAGEVVERPASVVKELIENSLDAGATDIHIDIERGGAQRICIRDNGSGIPKDELALALMRHATSKIHDLDDLENILSLGFRGEALASISSVSRLTLTSRPVEQTEAWQVHVEGRDMEAVIQPAAHPVGTTIDIKNLFFNTPARRKFLRADKTEFTHIDEVVRRIALAKPQVSLTLSHNDKVLRQYRRVTTQAQKLKRLGSICGNQFVENCIEISWQHEDLSLHGWVALPQFSRTVNDLNYSYINGRMMRDKTILHAIRQAYSEYIPADRFPAFVLFVDLNPHYVDVNVHPAKHEVRFQQPRLIHDFIYQGVLNALQSSYSNTILASSDSVFSTTALSQNTSDNIDGNHSENNYQNRQAAGKNIFASSRQPSNYDTKSSSISSSSNSNIPRYYPKKESVSLAKQDSYYHFLKSQQIESSSTINEPEIVQATHQETLNSTKSTAAPTDNSVFHPPANYLQPITFFPEKKLIIAQKLEDIYGLYIEDLHRLRIQLECQSNNISQRALLVPLVIYLEESEYENWNAQKDYFEQIGFDITEYIQANKWRLTVKKQPLFSLYQNLQHCLMHLLQESSPTKEHFIKKLSMLIRYEEIISMSQVLTLLASVEQLDKNGQGLNSILQLIPLKSITPLFSSP